MKAADLMTGNPLSVPPGTKLAVAIRLMLKHRISGLPVAGQDGRLHGIVTEGDLLRRSELGTERARPAWLRFLRGPGREAEDYTKSHTRKIDDVMTTELVCAEETTPAEELVRLMEHRRIKRVPIVRDGILVGIVSRADLLRALSECLELEEDSGGATDDDSIRKGLAATLAGLRWAPRQGLRTTVTDGVVELDGVVNDDRERWALIVAAENVPGVRRVEDRLVTVEPASGMAIPGP